MLEEEKGVRSREGGERRCWSRRGGWEMLEEERGRIWGGEVTPFCVPALSSCWHSLTLCNP
jgi:hypothetical protein